MAQGRWVEIVTSRDEPVCAGTISHLDALVEAAFEVIGEAPPDHRFVRYEWIEAEDGAPLIASGRYSVLGDAVEIISNQLVHEHELVHAVHSHAWPRSNLFLHEGLAVLLDTQRALVQPLEWRRGVTLDEVLEATSMEPADYHDAWFLVSQIVFEHGMQGLRDLWHAVPAGTSAEGVRSAYAELFGRSIDALIEPYYVGETEGVEIWADRRACSLVLCPHGSEPWQGDVWSASGPGGCEEDARAIGPEWHHDSIGIGSVWRSYVLEIDGEAHDVTTPDTIYDVHSHRVQPLGSVGALLDRCWLNCDTVGRIGIWPGEPRELDLRPGRYRVDVRADLENLPEPSLGTLEVERLEE